MSARKEKKPGVTLPAYIKETDYPGGDGPEWVSAAIGTASCLRGVTRHLSDDGDETALVLHFANGRDQMFKPARLVTTRRLPETLGALGFPVPYYTPPDLAVLGQAIGRIADRARDSSEESAGADMVSVVVQWVKNCLSRSVPFELTGREGADVRAAIEFAHKETFIGTCGLISEPKRKALLVWTVPPRTAIRQALGTAADGTITLYLTRAGLVRERLAARPGPGGWKNPDLPVWVLYNGWQGIYFDFPPYSRDSGANGGDPLGSVGDLYTHARPRAHMREIGTERSTTGAPEPNPGERSTTAAEEGE
jgi:hypothetical protein